MQRPCAGSTVNEQAASDSATTSGRSTSASAEPSTAASMAAWRVLWKAGVNPHRFIDTRTSGDSVAGSFPSPTAKPPPGGGGAGGARAPPVHTEERPVSPHAADAAGDRRRADHGVGQAEAHQRVGVAV